MQPIFRIIPSYCFNPYEGTKAVFGGVVEKVKETMGPMAMGLIITAVIIFFILVAHFKKVNLASTPTTTKLALPPSATYWMPRPTTSRATTST